MASENPKEMDRIVSFFLNGCWVLEAYKAIKKEDVPDPEGLNDRALKLIEDTILACKGNRPDSQELTIDDGLMLLEGLVLRFHEAILDNENFN